MNVYIEDPTRSLGIILQLQTFSHVLSKFKCTNPNVTKKVKIRVAYSVYEFLFGCLFLVVAIENHNLLFVINITA